MPKIFIYVLDVIIFVFLLTIAYCIGYGLFTMEKYQAKDIQKILAIPKFRYDYIMTRIRIEPDIEKVSGTGRTNLYSFRKLIEMGIANYAIDGGIKPDIIRTSIEQIVYYDFTENWKYFDPDSETRLLSFHTGFGRGNYFFCFSGDVSDHSKRMTIYKFSNEIQAMIKQSAEIQVMPLEISSGKMPNALLDMLQKHYGLESAFVFSTLNLSEIKNEILLKR